MSVEYLDVRGTVLHFTERAVLLGIGNKGRKEWFPKSVLEMEPTFEKGEEIVIRVKESFLDGACPWVMREDYEVYDGE